MITIVSHSGRKETMTAQKRKSR